MSRRKKTSHRLNVKFEVIEDLADKVRRDSPPLFDGHDWQLTRHSAAYACKDGSITLSFVWHARDANATMTRTIRGLRLEAA